MTIQHFIKKPVVVEAIRLNRGNTVEVCTFITDGGGRYYINTHPTNATKDEIYLQTLEGEMRAADGDWIIRGVVGEFYPCRDDIFQSTYEETSSDTPRTEQADDTQGC